MVGWAHGKNEVVCVVLMGIAGSEFILRSED